MTSKHFDKTLNRVGRIIAMSLVIPCAFAGLVGNPASFAAALIFLRFATQPGGSVATLAPFVVPLADRFGVLPGKRDKNAGRSH